MCCLYSVKTQSMFYFFFFFFETNRDGEKKE